ncbi:hypothetical protein [Sanguibacter suarezii]|uniref:hypothetical protein n=1 Tax=Sanguibacter suarezii TaxID=60921 RepID=UPI000837872E|nr:hypothetical protein [Sanguibacter suarezii]
MSSSPSRSDAPKEPDDAPSARRVDDATAHVRTVLARAVDRLSAAGARDEVLAEYVEARKVLGLTRQAVLRPVARAWRLGALLLGRDGTLYATGSIVRAGEAGVRNYQSQSAEDRRDLRAAALRGKVAPGETVNHGWRVLDPASIFRAASTDVVFGAADGTVRVRWNAALGDDASRELGAYIDERVGLLVDPLDIP